MHVPRCYDELRAAILRPQNWLTRPRLQAFIQHLPCYPNRYHSQAKLCCIWEAPVGQLRPELDEPPIAHSPREKVHVYLQAFRSQYVIYHE